MGLGVVVAGWQPGLGMHARGVGGQERDQNTEHARGAVPVGLGLGQEFLLRRLKGSRWRWWGGGSPPSPAGAGRGAAPQHRCEPGQVSGDRQGLPRLRRRRRRVGVRRFLGCAPGEDGDPTCPSQERALPPHPAWRNPSFVRGPGRGDGAS